MRYISTRGQAPDTGFTGAMLAGLAPDGGLYVPAEWPSLAGELEALRGRPYGEVALAVLRPFVGGEIADAELEAMIAEAYGSFGHAAVTPLVQLDAGHWLLELFHGPTLAFKDVAMQLLARLMDHALARAGRRATIVGATSGDTGSAAIEAFAGSSRCDVFIIHPSGRVSEVQRRQMTTVLRPNVHNIAIEGTFDDAQAMLKAMFADAAFRDTVALSGVNSINWARIVAQVVYYVTAALALGAPARPVSFTVPTGNFGDIFAGHVARRLGVPIERLVVATNVNDILDRALRTGRYEVRAVAASQSPSMDIQVSSNFERLLFEASGGDAAAVTALMESLRRSGGFTLPSAILAAIRAGFDSGAAGEAETAACIRDTLRASGELLDPHTAVGYAVARRQPASATPMVTLATAHPAKFPDAVEAASGIRPALPARLGDLMQREERCTVMPNDLAAVMAHIGARRPAAA